MEPAINQNTEVKISPSMPYFDASDAMFSLELFAIFQPVDGWSGVPCRRAAEANGIGRGHSQQLLLHPFWPGPIRSTWEGEEKEK